MPAGWAAAAAAVVGGISANNQADAAKDAATQQTNAAREASDVQRNQYALTRADNAPFLATGTAANDRLKSLLGLQPGAPKDYKDWSRSDFIDAYQKLFQSRGVANQPLQSITSELDNRINDLSNPDVTRYFDDLGLKKYGPTAAPDQATTGENSPLLRKFTQQDLEQDPVYTAGLKFGLDRGTEGINARATASGMYDSGQTLKALTQFGTDYGSTKAGESYNRFINDQNNTFNKLSGISGTGQVATNQVASSGMNAANNIGASVEGAGNARAAGIVGGANAWGGAVNNANNAFNNYSSNKRLDALLANYNSSSRSPYSSGPSQPYYTGYDSGGEYAYG